MIPNPKGQEQQQNSCLQKKIVGVQILMHEVTAALSGIVKPTAQCFVIQLRIVTTTYSGVGNPMLPVKV